MSERCSFTKPDGSRCGGKARRGESLCSFHSADAGVAERQRQGRSKGGRTSRRKPAVVPGGSPDFVLLSAGDMREMLAKCINWTLKGQLDPKVANAAGYLAGLLTKSIEMDELTRRVEALERAARLHQGSGHMGGRL
jgi:hypothetical protein